MGDSADPEAFVQCPYDSNHQMRNKRIQIHLINCRKSNPDQAKRMAKCPFNAKHIVPRVELMIHKMSCPDRASVDREILHDTQQTENSLQRSTVPIVNHDIKSDENWDSAGEDVGTTMPSGNRPSNGCQLPVYLQHKPAATGGSADILYNTKQSTPFVGGGRGLTRRDGGWEGGFCAVGIGRGLAADGGNVSSHQPIDQVSVPTSSASVYVSHGLSLAGVGRGGGQGLKLAPPPSATTTAVGSAACSVITLVGPPPATVVDASCLSGKQLPDKDDNYASMDENKKNERKLRKKLNEILRLEQQHKSGKQLNEDQLKKLSSRDDIEKQLYKLRVN